MLMHYVPEVQRIEQVQDEAESVSNAEFAKLEKAHEKKGAETHSHTHSDGCCSGH